jgi:hypothetical protein
MRFLSRFEVILTDRCRNFVCFVAMVLALNVFGAVSLPATKTQPAVRPFVNEVDAWAMLFQMMSRLESAIAKQELSLIDSEDPFASAAVSSLLAELKKQPGTQDVAQKMKWIGFVRLISTLHETADRNDFEKAAALMKQVRQEFEQLQAVADAKTLAAARELAKRYTCPMHPDVVGAKNDLCPKCGMPLDQALVLFPAHFADGNDAAWRQVTATVSTDGPLQPGKIAHAILHLRRSMGHPVTIDQLLETHTRKIHLLIIDGSLTDYHHEHPEPTKVAGDYTFEFTPAKPGSYLAWVDLRPLPLGLQEYDKTMIAGMGELPRIGDRETVLSTDSQGYHFELVLSGSEIRAGEPVDARLTITRGGKGFDRLEPVMGAFAHIVGFNEDRETVLHIHPIESRVLRAGDRGGPVLQFKIYATKPGFTRFFAQLQIDGRQLFVPFALPVLKESTVN